MSVSSFYRGRMYPTKGGYAGHLARLRGVHKRMLGNRRMGALMRARSRRSGFGRSGPRDMEYKCVDVAHGPSAVDTTGGLALINGCGRGDDLHERTGRRTTIKSIEIRGYNYVTTGSGTDQIHRVVLVLDKQPNGAAMTIAQLLNSASHLSPRNLENRARFQILSDKRWALNSDAAAEPGARKVWKIYRRVNFPVTYNSGDAGTIADITTNSLYVVYIGSNAAGVTAGSIQFHSRIRYTDN